MTTPFLRLSSVTKGFGSSGGIHAVSLDLDPGECVVLVGPSGCGKTTLLRLIAGLDAPEDGEIWIEQQQVASAGRNRVSPGDRGIGFVFQDLALWPHLTVREQLDFVLHPTGRAKADRPRRIGEVLDLFHVASSLAGRYPHQLSGGEQQRVALGARPRRFATAVAARRTIFQPRSGPACRAPGRAGHVTASTSCADDLCDPRSRRRRCAG